MIKVVTNNSNIKNVVNLTNLNIGGTGGSKIICTNNVFDLSKFILLKKKNKTFSRYNIVNNNSNLLKMLII